MCEGEREFGGADATGSGHSGDEEALVAEGIEHFIWSKTNPLWSQYKVNLSDFGIDFGENKLFAFFVHTTQGNCVILRKQHESFVVDAGGQGWLPEFRLERILEGSEIRLVVVTHAHSDHYSAIPLLSKFWQGSDRGSPLVVLGGTEKDWKEGTEKAKELVQDVFKGLDIRYTGGDSFFDGDARTHDMVYEEVQFKFFREGLETGSTVNERSAVVKVSFGAGSILFVGDAGGKRLLELIGTNIGFNGLYEVIRMSHSPIPDELPAKHDAWVRTASLDSFKAFYRELYEAIDNGLPFLDDSALEELFRKTEEAKRVREELTSSSIVVLPHHGSETERAGEWLTFLSMHATATYIVCGSAFGASSVPKWNLVQQIRGKSPVLHLAHPVIFAKGDRKVFQMTRRGIFVTGAAPGRMECFALCSAEVSKLDVWRRSDGKPYRWYDILPGPCDSESVKDTNGSAGFQLPCCTAS